MLIVNVIVIDFYLIITIFYFLNFQCVNISFRLDINIKLLLIIELYLGSKKATLWSQTQELCQQLWTLKWLCRAQFSRQSSFQSTNLSFISHTPPLLLHKFLSAHEGIAQSDLLNAASALAYAMYPLMILRFFNNSFYLLNT